MTEREQAISDILDQWRTVSEGDRERLVLALADCTRYPANQTARIRLIIDHVIETRALRCEAMR